MLCRELLGVPWVDVGEIEILCLNWEALGGCVRWIGSCQSSLDTLRPGAARPQTRGAWCSRNDGPAGV